MRPFREYIPHIWRTANLLRHVRPDVVHLNLPWPYSGFGTIVCCGLLKVPAAVVFHSIPRRFSYSRSRLKAYAWARSRKQKWIAISANSRKFISESFGIPLEEIQLIYNGTKLQSNYISLASEKIIEIRTEVRQELDFPETSILLLTVGRLSESKGYRELIEVVPPIVQEFPEVRFVWVGEGDLGKFLLNRCKQYEVEDKVHLLGYRSDVPRLLRAADLFVFPTHFEGFGLAIVEAMAHDLPIVSSDAKSIPEIIENNVNGLLFPSQNSKSLLETIRYALKHPDEMRVMAKEAKSNVERFSEEKMIEETLKLLEKMGSFIIGQNR